jgi:hypothetical protein
MTLIPRPGAFPMTETLLTADLFGHDREPDFSQRRLSPSTFAVDEED